MTLEEIVARLDGAIREGDGWRARCPAHGGKSKGSLHVGLGDDGRTLLHCFAGCSAEDVVAALGLSLADLAPPSTSTPREQVWALRDLDGTIVAEHHRLDLPGVDKRVWWTMPGGHPKGLAGRKANTLPLYGVHEIGTATTIVLCEGEKARDALAARGVCAVGTVTGADGCPTDDVLRSLAGRDVVLWPDADDVGRRHMERIAARLVGLGVTPRWLVVPEAREKDDAADYRGTDGALRALLAEAPPWSARPRQASGGPSRAREWRATDSTASRRAPHVAGPPAATAAMFPPPLDLLVRASVDCCETNEAAIAAQFIVAAGNLMGRGPALYVGETRHTAAEYVIIIGPSSTGGKGDSCRYALAPFECVDRDWFNRAGGGLSSGEGLIHAVRDPIHGVDKKGNEVLVDPGVADKRLLAVEAEFSSVLKQFLRDGNILSNTLREAWDGKSVLRTLTKTSPTRATHAHVSVIGHTTSADLSRYLGDLDCRNGVANRMLFVAAQRVRDVPRPVRMPSMVREQCADVLRRAREHAGRLDTVGWTAHAADLWDAGYADIRAPRPGLLGDIAARGAAHVSRLALIFTLLDRKDAIDVPHLRAAVAWRDYALGSARGVFGERTGNPDADRIMAELLPGDSATLSEIRETLFRDKITSARLAAALDLLESMREIARTERMTAGRTATVVTRLVREAKAA